MRRLLFLLCVASFCHAGILVNVEEARNLIKETNTVILFIGPEPLYQESHIAGSKLVPIDAAFSRVGENDLNDELPTPDTFQRFILEAGIRPDSKVLLVYGNERGTFVTGRLLLAFDSYGFSGEIFILNGGQIAWDKSEFQVEPAGVDNKEYEPFMISENISSVAEMNWVSKNLKNNSIRLVDARPASLYQGKGRSSEGHIPGAVNIEFNSVIDNNSPHLFRSTEELAEIFRNGGVMDNDMVVPYCGTGIWAANIYIVARHLGYDTKFYDGSFHEWSEKEMEIEKPVKRGLFR